MDLSRIEMLTRKALEAEAERRGIRDPHLRTRTELIRLILRQQYGGPVGRGRKRMADGLQTLRQARDLLGAAVEAAAENLPGPFRRTSPGTTASPAPAPPKQAPAGSPSAPRAPTFTAEPDQRKTREQPVSPRVLEAADNFDEGPFAAFEPPRPAQPEPDVPRTMATSDVVPASEAALRASGPEAAPPVPDLGPGAAGPGEPAPAAQAPGSDAEALKDTQTLEPTPPAAPSDSDVEALKDTQTLEPRDLPSESHAAPEPARASAGKGPKAATTIVFEQEPIRTHSMARLLARQGHRERALAIYEELLARHTDEPTLRNEAEILRSGGDVEQIPSHLPGPTSELPLPVSADHIACDGSLEQGLGVHWTVTPEGTARAAAVLGEPGELAVRVVAITRDPERVVRSEITEHGPVAEEASWQAPRLDAETRCFVAIGLRSRERFVSIAHTRPRG